MVKSSFFISIIFLSWLFEPVCHAQSYKQVEFEASDGLQITADLYHMNKEFPTIIMFHQSASSRGEYRDIAEKIRLEGFNCLAVDLRWGKNDFWNKIPNLTAHRNGTYPIIENYENTTEYQMEKVWPVIFEAYKDMEASISYLKTENYKEDYLLMGSSFSAMMIFKLCKEYNEISGVMAFSPAEYYPGNGQLLESWLPDVDVPLFLCAGNDDEERAAVDAVAAKAGSGTIKRNYSEGRHGASVLINQKSDWEPLLAFLDDFKPEEKFQIGYKTMLINRPDSDYLKKQSSDNELNSKPIQISMWYPCTNVQNPEYLTYEDYIKNFAPNLSDEENINRFSQVLTSFSGIDSLDRNSYQIFLQKSANSTFGKEMIDYEFPAVVICGAHPLYHLELAELIASSGFLVIALPRLGLVQNERLPYDVNGATEYTKDLDFVLSDMKSRKLLSDSAVSFIAWGYEGVPAYEYAKKRGGIRIFISLDASLGYAYGGDLVIDTNAFYNPSASFPLIHHSGSIMDFGKSFAMLDKLKNNGNEVVIEIIKDLPHANFTSLRSATFAILNKSEIVPEYQTIMKQIVNSLKGQWNGERKRLN